VLELVPVALAVLAACLATYTDLRERIIPNKLTLPLMAFGVAFNAALGLARRDPLLAASGAVGGGLAFGMGYALWLVGGWAGGDVKLFAALGALLPFHRPPSCAAPYPFPITVLFNSFISVAPALLVYISVGLARLPGVGRRLLSPLRASARALAGEPFLLVGFSSLGLRLAQLIGLGLPAGVALTLALIVAAHLLPRLVALPLALALTGLALLSSPAAAAKALVAVAAALPFLRLLWDAARIASKEVLQEEVDVGELKEGMIPAQAICLRGGRVVRREASLLGLGLKLRRGDRLLADPRVAAGLTRGQVIALKRLAREGRLKGKIRIKKGMPYAPALALGLVISLAYGDVYWRFLLALAGA
jgi:preflagellin peptidase FlaK